MAQKPESFDVDQSPEMLRLAEDVARSGVPRVLRRNGEALAIVRPAGSRQRVQRADRRLPKNAWLADLVGIGESADSADVSEDIHRCVADVTRAEGGESSPE